MRRPNPSTTLVPILCAVVAADVTLLASTAARPGHAADPASRSPETCTTSQLSATAGLPGAGGPTGTVRVAVLNTGAAACRLQGPASVTLLDGSGQALPTSERPGAPATAVVVKPDGRAVLTVTYSVPGAGEVTPTARGIRATFGSGGPTVRATTGPFAAAAGVVGAGDLSVG